MKQFSLEEYLKNPSRRVVTADGDEVRIICTDRKSDGGFCIVGLLSFNTYGEQPVRCWKEDGKFSNSNTDDCNLWFDTTKYTGWVNVYDDGHGQTTSNEVIFCSKEYAEEYARSHDKSKHYRTMVKIEWEE